MHCPKCYKHYEGGNFCAECGLLLVEDTPKPESPNISLNLGDANAISGGLSVSDSHNVHNEDRSVHNVSTTNITQVSAQKTELELLQDKKSIFLVECKRAYEDNVLDPTEEIALEECRLKLGLDEVTAKSILDSVRLLADRNARKTSLNPIAKTKLKILSDKLQKNDVEAIKGQLDNMEAIVNKFEHDELSRKYFLALAILKPDKCIKLKENSGVDSYWESYWTYLAYIKEGKDSAAEELLAGMDRFADYPEDNMTVLAVAGALMAGKVDEAREYLDALTGDYTPELQRFVDSIYLLLDPESAESMGADEEACAFYLVNMFGQKDPKVKADEKIAREEAERKAREEAERKLREEAEREAREEAERLAREEVEKKRKAKEEAERKAREETERQRKAEAEREGKEVAKRKAKDGAERKTEVVKETKPSVTYSQDFLDALDYYEGHNGKKKNYTKAVELFKKASCSNNLAEVGYASNALGICYYNGLGVAKDYTKAVDCFLQSANANDCRGTVNLGMCYKDGFGVNKNAGKAKKYLSTGKELAEAVLKTSNDIIQLKRANVLLGDMYRQAVGVNKDLDCALAYYKSAESLGENFIADSIGICLNEKGDFQSAVSYFSEAIKNGNYYCALQLANYYEFGRPGIDIDIEKAKSLYEKASKMPEDQNNNNYAKNAYEELLNPLSFASEKITAEMQDDKILLIVLNNVKVSGINGTFHIQCKFYDGKTVVGEATENRFCRDKSQKVFEKIDVPFKAELLVPDLGTRRFRIKIKIDYLGQVISESDFINITVSCSRSLFKKTYNVKL